MFNLLNAEGLAFLVRFIISYDKSVTKSGRLVVYADSGISLDVDRIISVIQKMCSILIMVPGTEYKSLFNLLKLTIP